MDSNTWALLVIAILNAITAFMAWRTRRDIGDLEKNTNSLVAQLVSTTKTEAHAAGMKAEKDKSP